jgi:hypothetical protein
MRKKNVKLLSLLLSLVLILTMIPMIAMAAGGTTLYVKPNANWNIDNARFAAYYFQSGKSDGWVDCTLVKDGIYTCVVPEGYTNVIFCRMNPATTINNWSNKWNQTADLKVPTDGTNLCTITEGKWDGDKGTWSTYGTSTPDPTPDPTPQPETAYYVSGSMQGWSLKDDAYKMVKSGDNYVLTVTLEAGNYEFKVNDGTWDNAWPSANYELVVAEACEVTITLNASFEVTATGTGIPTEEVETETLTIYVKNEAWTNMNVYGWDGADFGGWPGSAISELETNAGWYSCSLEISKAASIIFNNGTEQTEDWTGVEAGTYWVVLSEKNAENNKYLVNPSTTAPEGWVDENAGDVDNNETENDNNNSDNNDTNNDTNNDSNNTVTESYNRVYSSAAVTGDFSTLSNPSVTDSWNPASASGDMVYLGNGVYKYVLTFDAPTEEITVQYKIAFDDKWDHSIGITDGKFEDGGFENNLTITIPAGTGSVTIIASEKDWVAYNSLQNAEEVNSYLEIALKGDNNMVILYVFMLVAGLGMAVVAAKKKFA